MGATPSETPSDTPIPICPATMPPTGLLAPTTPSRGHYAGTYSSYVPNLGQIRSHRHPRAPLRIVELCGGFATGLKALLGAGYAINSYVWEGIDPDAHTAASHRIARLRLQFPHLLPPETTKDWDSRLPMDVRTIFLELLRATFPEGIYLLLVSPPMLANHLSRPHREHTPSGPYVVQHILRLILHVSEAQPGGVGYLWNSSELHPPSANTLSLLGQDTLLDAPKCGSRAYRNTRIRQSLLPQDTLAAEHARMLPPTRPIEDALETSCLFVWSTHHSPKLAGPNQTQPTPFR